MKKQKLSLNLSLVLIIVASLMNAMAIKVNAGEVNAQGSTSESSGYSGGNFSPANQTINTQVAPGISNSIQINNGEITVSTTVQAKVNQVASTVLNQVAINEAIGSNQVGNISINDSDGDKTIGNGDGGENTTTNGTEFSPTNVIVSILVKGTSVSDVISQIQNILIETGVNSASVETLINSMVGMISNSSAALSGIPVASNKSLVPGDKLAQNSQPTVDINKLNAAINAYNKIITESDVKTLKKLSANPEFMAIRNLLNQFRTALNS